MNTKKCTNCGEIKPINEFYKQKDSKYGLQPECKQCNNDRAKNYHLTKDGLITKIYGGQRSGSKKRNYSMPTYTKWELKEWLYSQPLFHKLFENWVQSKFDKMLAPSVDRINDYKSYSFDNIQLMTWKKNKQKGNYDIRNGVNNKQSKAVRCINIITGNVIEFYSIREASRQLNIDQSSISKCCNGKRKTTKVYIWKYKQ